jgi:hypothetical protein
VALAAHAGHVYRLQMISVRAAELTAPTGVDRNNRLPELALELAHARAFFTQGV